MHHEATRTGRMTAEQIGLQTLWALLQGSPLAVFAVDKEGSILIWNQASERLFGWVEQEILGRTNPIIPEGRESEFQQLRDRALAGEVYTDMDVRVLRKDGSQVEISISTAPLRDEAEVIFGLMAVVKDISERKRMEEALRASLQKSQRIFDETIHALAAEVEKRDPYTAGHQHRVARLAGAIAEKMGLPTEQVKGIRTAAIVHDIGKISIPVEILCKSGWLSDIERSFLEIHPQSGFEILEGIEFPWPIARIVQQHHERRDGSGYPFGLKDDEILPEARILTVADVVEAAASYRPYRPANGIDFALDEIKTHRDGYYDPEVVDACLILFNEGFKLE
ncbi:HD-GYP domain-containing protein [Geopsychrobacter electrodiphilus]|uniref:HD-GYP domain-containing protein n=1 Tax=Geopsychrobacter electrodiphilus TaxID=225196 RepID=UPI00037B6A62|nr:HD domain-containing phosphohydrolase [Geopsychrobacter electrodiphilus]